MATETGRRSLNTLQTPRDKLAWLVEGVFERGLPEDPFGKLVQTINHRSLIISSKRSCQHGHSVCDDEYLSLRNQCITAKKLVQQLSEQFPGPKDRKSDRDQFAEEAHAFLENPENEKWMDQFFILECTLKRRSTEIPHVEVEENSSGAKPDMDSPTPLTTENTGGETAARTSECTTCRGDDETSQHSQVRVDYTSRITSTLPTTKAENASTIALSQQDDRVKRYSGQKDKFRDKFRDKMSQLRQKLSSQRMISVSS